MWILSDSRVTLPPSQPTRHTHQHNSQPHHPTTPTMTPTDKGDLTGLFPLECHGASPIYTTTVLLDPQGSFHVVAQSHPSGGLAAVIHRRMASCTARFSINGWNVSTSYMRRTVTVLTNVRDGTEPSARFRQQTGGVAHGTPLHF